MFKTEDTTSLHTCPVGKALGLTFDQQSGFHPVLCQTLCIGVKHSSEWEGASHDCNLLMETEMSDHSLFLLGNKTSWWYLEFKISITGGAARPDELFPVVVWGCVGR